MNWTEFYEQVCEPVRDVIDTGPYPRCDYPTSKVQLNDRKKGIVVYKGGEGRNKSMKSGMQSVVYFNPVFVQENLRGVPDKITDRHSKEKVREVFRKL